MTVQEMIAALLGTGLSQKAIADLAGTTQPTIHRAAKGAGVLYETGKAIERLYEASVICTDKATA
jgi:transcriptional regulator with XRE-family HTH domain